MKQFYLPVVSFLVAIGSYGQNTNVSKESLSLNQSQQIATVPNVGHFKLHLNSDKKNYYTDFYFNEDSTYGLDIGYDAAMPMGKTPNFSIYSKLIDGGEYANVDFAIQSLPYSCITNQTIIPISVNIPEGLECTINISKSYLSSEITVYLEDTYTQKVTLLNTSTYKFTTEIALNGEGRFNILFNKQKGTLSQDTNTLNSIKIFNISSEPVLNVKGILTEKTELRVIDLQGRVVTHAKLDNGSSLNRINISQLNLGVYVVLLQTATTQKTQKIIIR